MNRQKIIQFAKSAGVSLANDQQIKFEGPMWLCLERFSALVVAEEREACAKACEDLMVFMEGGYAEGCLDCVNAIRNRHEL